MLHSKDNPAYTAGCKTISSYAKKMHKKAHWNLEGFGGSFNDDIKNLDLSFGIQKYVDIKEARHLAVEAIDGFLDFVNHDSKTCKYLSHRPFNYKDIKFSFSFDGEDGDHAGNGYIACVSLLKDQLIYCVYDPTKPSDGNPLEIIHEEPYEEAYKIVMGKELPQAAAEKEPS